MKTTINQTLTTVTTNLDTFEDIMNIFEKARPSVMLYKLPSYRATLKKFYSAVVKDAFLSRVLASLKQHEKDTYIHTLDVAFLSFAFTHAFGIREKALEFAVGSILHDIGKLFVPAAILESKNQLSDEEWATIQKHPQSGFDFLGAYEQNKVETSTLPMTSLVSELVLYHHQHPEGLGYPAVKGDFNYKFEYLVIRMMDEMSAMTLPRYRPGLPVERSLQFMQENFAKGTYRLPVSHVEKVALLFTCDNNRSSELEELLS